MDLIPYSTQHIHPSDIRAVEKVLRSKWLTQGPAIENFERAIAKVAQAKYAVTFNSGTAALHAAYFAAGIGEGDEVIVPAITFAATANSVLYLGGKPVFADVDPTTGNVLPKDIEKKITKRTKLIVGVDFGGRPADLRALRAMAKKHKVIFIEDGAQSFGGLYGKKPLGSQADMTMFSFHPVKSITTAEGGVITTNDIQYAEKLRLFRSHGITKDVNVFERQGQGEWYQEMQVLGFNYRISDMQAALGESQLKRMSSYIAKRRAAAARYHSILEGLPIRLPPMDSDTARSAWHLYPIILAPNIAPARDAILSALRRSGIGAQVHYIPVYRHVYYEKLGYKKGLCPNAEAFSAAEISIPLFPGITRAQQMFVASTLRKIVIAIHNEA